MAESDKIRSSDIIQDDIFDNYVKSTKDALKVTDELQKSLLKVAETNAKIAKNASKDLSKVENIEKANKALNESKQATEAANKIEKERIRLIERLNSIKSRETNEVIRLREEIKKETLVKRQNELETNKQLGAYTNLTAKLNRLRREFKDVAAAEGESSKAAQRLLRDVQKLDGQLKKIDASAGQFQRNVGNYPSVFKNATSALKTFVGAFGIVTGIQLFTRAIGDAFNRIRDFDREVVNLVAILGGTRESAKDLEDAIIRVAGSSIKTSNEVAQLATELVKLGNSKQEVIDLLKPVNDFAIALNATSEESAAFVGSVVNAFGASSKEVGRFTDVLAKAATSSALDFQKLQDSFTFVAPVAKQIGQTIEETAAQLGVLADNGIKASSSGRLLKTIFATLAQDGRTLEDALNEINASTDKVSTATNLFGKEAFGIALVLAENTEKVKELTKEYENAQGSLEELTNKQLESLDAKLKILDSTWESFILSVVNGESVLSKVLISTIEAVTKVVDNLRFSLIGLEAQVKEVAFEEATERFNTFLGSIDEGATKVEKLAKAQTALKQVTEGLSQTNKVLEEDFGGLGASVFDIEKKYQAYREAVGDISKADFLKYRENNLLIAETNRELIKSYQLYIEELEKVEEIEERTGGGDKEQIIRDNRLLAEAYFLQAKAISQIAEAKEKELTAVEKLQKALDDELLKRKEVNNELERGLQAELEADQARLDSKLATSRAISNLLDTARTEDENTQQAIVAAQKALAIGEIAINLQREISGIRQSNADKENRDELNRIQITQARTTALLGTATVLAQGSFYEGTEMVERDLKGAKVHSGRDGYFINVDGRERILNPGQNAKVGNISNDELADLAMLYNRGQLINPMTDVNINLSDRKTEDKTYLYLQKTNDKLDALINKPIQQVNVDSFGNLVEVVYRNGVKDTRRFKGKDWI